MGRRGQGVDSVREMGVIVEECWRSECRMFWGIPQSSYDHDCEWLKQSGSESGS